MSLFYAWKKGSREIPLEKFQQNYVNYKKEEQTPFYGIDSSIISLPEMRENCEQLIGNPHILQEITYKKVTINPMVKSFC